MAFIFFFLSEKVHPLVCFSSLFFLYFLISSFCHSRHLFFSTPLHVLFPSQCAAIRLYSTRILIIIYVHILNLNIQSYSQHCRHLWGVFFFLLLSVCGNISNICPSHSFSFFPLCAARSPLPPVRGIVKLKTINVIATATEFGEIRNSLGASLLMTCKEMNLQGQKARGRKRKERRGRGGGGECSPGREIISRLGSSIGLWPLRVTELNESSLCLFFCLSQFVSSSLPPCLSDVTQQTQPRGNPGWSSEQWRSHSLKVRAESRPPLTNNGSSQGDEARLFLEGCYPPAFCVGNKTSEIHQKQT